MKEFITTT